MLVRSLIATGGTMERTPPTKRPGSCSWRPEYQPNASEPEGRVGGAPSTGTVLYAGYTSPSVVWSSDAYWLPNSTISFV